MIKTELNLECGKRLKECLSDFPMTQNKLASLTGYTQQYISNIIVGKKPMTIKAAKLFSEYLNIQEEYLLCESNYKTKQEEIQETFKTNRKKWNDLENAVQTLISNTGYKIVGRYAADWDRHKNNIGGFQYEKYSDALQDIENGIIEADDLYDIVDVMYEIETPRKEIMFVRRSLFIAIKQSIESYAEFAMRNLETAFMCDNFFPDKTPGSEIPDKKWKW